MSIKNSNHELSSSFFPSFFQVKKTTTWKRAADYRRWQTNKRGKRKGILILSFSFPLRCEKGFSCGNLSIPSSFRESEIQLGRTKVERLRKMYLLSAFIRPTNQPSSFPLISTGSLGALQHSLYCWRARKVPNFKKGKEIHILKVLKIRGTPQGKERKERVACLLIHIKCRDVGQPHLIEDVWRHRYSNCKLGYIRRMEGTIQKFN